MRLRRSKWDAPAQNKKRCACAYDFVSHCAVRMRISLWGVHALFIFGSNFKIPGHLCSQIYYMFLKNEECALQKQSNKKICSPVIYFYSENRFLVQQLIIVIRVTNEFPATETEGGYMSMRASYTSNLSFRLLFQNFPKRVATPTLT